MANIPANQADTHVVGIDPPSWLQDQVENFRDSNENKPPHVCMVECKNNEADSTAVQLPKFIEIL